MQRGRGDRDDFFNFGGDPFAGFGGRGSVISNIVGNDPFDDPFFSRPFGGIMFNGPSIFGGSGMFGGPSMFSSPSMFGASGSLFGDLPTVGFLEHQAPPQPNRSRGPVIQELSSDEQEDNSKDDKEREGNPRKHSRSNNEPLVQEPDDEIEEKKSRHVQYGSKHNIAENTQLQTHSFSFQSSTVTYGGANGAYYTSSTTRRIGGDGVALEEMKEADTTTRRATHRVSRGIRNKGHSVTRKLHSDGKVEATQTLHNLNELELTGFEEAWKGSARKHLPGWNQGVDVLENGNTGASSSGQNVQASRGWALPSTEQPRNPERTRRHRATSPNSDYRRS